MPLNLRHCSARKASWLCSCGPAASILCCRNPLEVNGSAIIMNRCDGVASLTGNADLTQATRSNSLAAELLGVGGGHLADVFATGDFVVPGLRYRLHWAAFDTGTTGAAGIKEAIGGMGGSTARRDRDVCSNDDGADADRFSCFTDKTVRQTKGAESCGISCVAF